MLAVQIKLSRFILYNVSALHDSRSSRSILYQAILGLWMLFNVFNRGATFPAIIVCAFFVSFLSSRLVYLRSLFYVRGLYGSGFAIPYYTI